MKVQKFCTENGLFTVVLFVLALCFSSSVKTSHYYVNTGSDISITEIVETISDASLHAGWGYLQDLVSSEPGKDLFFCFIINSPLMPSSRGTFNCLNLSFIFSDLPPPNFA